MPAGSASWLTRRFYWFGNVCWRLVDVFVGWERLLETFLLFGNVYLRQFCSLGTFIGLETFVLEGCIGWETLEPFLLIWDS